MSELIRVLVFRLDEQRYALPLATVERVIRAVEVTFLPNAPSVVMGVIDVAGRVLPVLNIRRRFRLPEREISPADQFVIAHTLRRPLALVIDEAQGMIECRESAVIDSTQIAPGLGRVQGVMKLEDGLVLIHDLEKFLFVEEARALDEAIATADEP